MNLKEKPVSEIHWRDAVGVIARNGRQALDLLNDVLDLSRMEAGNLVLQPQFCNPQEILNEALQQVRIKGGSQKNWDCTSSVIFHFPREVKIDSKRVVQVLTKSPEQRD